MRKFYNYFFTFLSLLLFSTTSLLAQNNFFYSQRVNGNIANAGVQEIQPEKFISFSADVPALKTFLWSLPQEADINNYRAIPSIMEIPMPNGKNARFQVWESSIQQEGLAAMFPDTKTFTGQGIDDKSATLKMDFSVQRGFHAQIISSEGTVYVDPYSRNSINNYISYSKADLRRKSSFSCDVTEMANNLSAQNNLPRINADCRGNQLRTYRLAVACTGEYARTLGAVNAADLHNFIVTTINRVNGVYERELSVRLVLVNNNHLIEYLDPATDQFTANNNPSGLLTESQNVITSIIGTANFDIGHTFCSANSGVAALRSVCSPTSKARGVTGQSNPTGDAFDIDYVAHEMGHQFGAAHTFNSSTCASAGGSIEPGGGTTIMAYAGICANSENIQPNSDDIFHGFSFDEIINFITTGGGAACGTVTNITNNLPQVTIVTPNNLTIPVNTPFTLEATATDADGDALTYNWEGWDIGPASSSWVDAGLSTSRPLFRTRVSKNNGVRTFPDMRVILANYPNNAAPVVMDGLKGEVLPKVAREMKFRVTVRDNKAGGGAVISAGGGGCQDATDFKVITAGTTPFSVLSPNGGESYAGGSLQTVTWNVASTDAAPFNVPNVRISYSTDGFATSQVLVASTANDGSEQVSIPVGVTSTARIRVEALGNIFFDISNQNFSVSAPVDGFEFNSPAAQTVTCNNETSVNYTLTNTAFGSFNSPITLSATGVPAGASIGFGTNPMSINGSSTVTITNVNTVRNGTYTIAVKGVGNGIERTRNLTLVVQAGAAPTISAQPASAAVCIGTNAVFSVTAAGASTYQWQVSSDGGTSFTDIATATTATLTVSNVSAADNNKVYRVRVIGQCNSVVSNAVTLTAQQAPAITASPTSVTLCENTSNTFSATATGTNLSYQWQVSTDAGSSYQDISGANSDSYSLSNIALSLSSNRYRLRVSGTCAPAAFTTAATLTVVAPPTIAANPVVFTQCETGTASFSVTGAGAGIIYGWQSSANNGASWQNITNAGNYAGATTSTLTINNLPTNLDGLQYRAVLSNATCTSPVASTAALLTVNPRPTVALTASQTAIQPGQVAQITAGIQPNAPGFNISWFRNETLIPGESGTTYAADVTKLGQYKVSILNPTTGCSNESSVLSINASASTRLFVYPIPNNGLFTVSYYNANWNGQRQSIAVYNSGGKQVYSSVLNLTGPYTLHPVNLQGQASGVYYVVLGDASGKKITETKMLIAY